MSNRTALLALALIIAVLLWRWLQQPEPDKFDTPGVGRFWKPTDKEHEHYRGVFTEPVGKVHGNGGSYGNLH